MNRELTKIVNKCLRLIVERSESGRSLEKKRITFLKRKLKRLNWPDDEANNYIAKSMGMSKRRASIL